VPEGSTVEVIVRFVGAMTMESPTDLVCAGFAVSATVAVKVAVPLADDVPEMIPVVGDRLSPAGRLPVVMDQV